MKPNYEVTYCPFYGCNRELIKIIECCNYTGLNEVKFYDWTSDEIKGSTDNTVAIFKIKYK